jgi:hypothetical protein
MNPQVQRVPFTFKGKTVMGNFSKFTSLKLHTICCFIDQVHELDALDIMSNLESNEIIAINVHMNAD